MSKFNVGDKVRYIGKDHDDIPKFYPPVGTIGTVIKQLNEYDDVYIQWEKGSTSKEDCWYCDKNDIELVKDEDMTNEEIWEMLEPKMKKNWLVPHWGDKELAYYQSDVINAIAIAYRSGYERAMKGRPFKFGEKKKKGGHWEPVDPDNLPKEGTKVRYAREDKEYKEIPLIALGDIGTFTFGKVSLLAGIKFDDGRFWDWICFNGAEDCLDMWVEDDE